MKYSIVYKVLVRIICGEYYRSNAGFFFVIIGFAFGLLRPVEHIALATYFVHSYFLLTLLFAVWTLYTLKTVQFTIRALALDENLFLSNLYLLPTAVRFVTLLLVQFILFEPVILYAAFMGYYAMHFHQFYALILLVVFNICSIGAAALYYLYQLKHITAERKQSRLGRYLDQSYTKPYFAFYLYHVLQRQLPLFILTKLFSLLLITATVKLYIIEDHSQVLLSLGILIAFSANAVLTFHFYRFEQVDVVLFKNLPLSLSRRLCYNLLTYICLLLPEILLLLRHLASDIHLWTALTLLLFGISLQLVLHSYLLYRPLDLEKFIRHIFFIILFFFVCILFRINVLLIASINIMIGYIFFRSYFYNTEIVILKENPEE